MCIDFFADWSHIFFLQFFCIDKVACACKNRRHLYAELLGQEERGGVETVFDIHTGFQI